MTTERGRSCRVRRPRRPSLRKLGSNPRSRLAVLALRTRATRLLWSQPASAHLGTEWRQLAQASTECPGSQLRARSQLARVSLNLDQQEYRTVALTFIATITLVHCCAEGITFQRNPYTPPADRITRRQAQRGDTTAREDDNEHESRSPRCLSQNPVCVGICMVSAPTMCGTGDTSAVLLVCGTLWPLSASRRITQTRPCSLRSPEFSGDPGIPLALHLTNSFESRKVPKLPRYLGC
jgi:hypothetical protein